MACPLLYRFRVVDRLPEQPSPAATRGTVVHAVLERLFDLPAAERTLAQASALPRARVGPAARRGARARAAVRGDPDELDLRTFLDGAVQLLETLLPPRGPDPARAGRARAAAWRPSSSPACCCAATSTDSTSRRDGEMRVVDYKTGRAPSRGLRGQGAVPDALLRPGPVADPRARSAAAAAALPRLGRGPALRAGRGRPARHRAQAPRSLGGHPAGQRAPATGGPTRAGCATGATTRRCARRFGGTPPPLPLLPVPAVPPSEANADRPSPRTPVDEV